MINASGHSHPEIARIESVEFRIRTLDGLQIVLPRSQLFLGADHKKDAIRNGTLRWAQARQNLRVNVWHALEQIGSKIWRIAEIEDFPMKARDDFRSQSI